MKRQLKPRARSPKPVAKQPKKQTSEGWKGWDDYAPFYDWENAQTLDRRDVDFWRRMAARWKLADVSCAVW